MSKTYEYVCHRMMNDLEIREKKVLELTDEGNDDEREGDAQGNFLDGDSTRTREFWIKVKIQGSLDNL